MSAIVTEEAVELDRRLESYRVELTGYCHGRLRSAADAEDAVQETLIRAWRAFERFEGRASLRTWLYRIARNVCTDIVAAKQRLAPPVDLGSSTVDEAACELGTGGDDPGDAVVAQEDLRLAFMAALLHLPPRQRAVLLLREVLRWRASEVADLLGTTIVSVNSALQRARAGLAAAGPTLSGPDQKAGLNSEQDRLLAGYLDAFERYDVDSLVALLGKSPAGR
jgi:RNA polymerase sigma-70 factor (ECF subfamily)